MPVDEEAVRSVQALGILQIQIQVTVVKLICKMKPYYLSREFVKVSGIPTGRNLTRTPKIGVRGKRGEDDLDGTVSPPPPLTPALPVLT